MTSLFTNRLIVVKETGQWSGSPETNIESSMSLSFKDELLNFKGHKNKATTVITDKYLNQVISLTLSLIISDTNMYEGGRCSMRKCWLMGSTCARLLGIRRRKDV